MSNRSAFLDMVAVSEGTSIVPNSDNGYMVLVGSTATHPLLFYSYAKHPNVINRTLNSTAAGRYQVLHRYAVAYTKLLNLPDFSPTSQDAIALQQIKESYALPDIDAGRFVDAVVKCAHLWASLPGANYGQHENKMTALQSAYVDAGGVLA